MAIINQRGKSSRRNKKLPYPGHRDLPGSSPRCPVVSPPPSCLLGRRPDLVPSPQAYALHLPRDPPPRASNRPSCRAPGVRHLSLGLSFLLTGPEIREFGAGCMQRGLGWEMPFWTRTPGAAGRGEAS